MAAGPAPLAWLVAAPLALAAAVAAHESAHWLTARCLGLEACLHIGAPLSA